MASDASLSALFSASPTLDDSCVRYELFLLRSASALATSAASAASAVPQEQRDRLAAESARDGMLAFAERETRGFLWHRHRFHLSVEPLPDALRGVEGLRSFYLTGETAVGDAIQDEWVVARLVFELSRQHREVVARLSDGDGEFLLIEAADGLPDWVTPDNSADRVLVHGGRVYIHRSSSTSHAPLADALQAMASANRDNHLGASKQFESGSLIQRALQSKLEQEIPLYIRENCHRARCLLPARAALVLMKQPELVAPAVEAFYYREPARAGLVCGKMSTFGQRSAGIHAVEKRVTFTRTMYAQLKQQRFHPPKPFLSTGGTSRYDVLLGSASSASAVRTRQCADLGMKLACGLELLYASDEACDQFGARYRDQIEAILAKDAGNNMQDDDVALQDDDESWMNVHPDALEEQLAMLGRGFDTERGADSSEKQDGPAVTGGAEELQHIANMFSSFLGGVSDVDGVQGAAPVQFDMSSFMNLLNGTHEDEASDASEDEFDSEEEDAALAEAMAEMEAELSTSTLAKSFVKPAAPNSAPADSDDEDGVDTHDENPGTPETPLDLDFNLLSNLLESVASQDGMAGPVSNILSELRLPSK